MVVNRRHSIWGAAALAAVAGYSSGAGASGEAGTWSGVLEVGALRLRLKLDIGSDNNATLLSLDQSAQLIPGHFKVSDSGRIELEFPGIRATYDGRLVAPDRMDGIFHQGGGSFPLVFERGEAALAPPQPPKPLDQARLVELRRQAGASALAARAVRRGAAARSWVDGEREIGSGIRVQPDDIWHLGSITKSMTATLVGHLVEAGAVRWDDTIGGILGGVLPDIKDAYRAATFRHLLSHRAGLPGNIPVPEILKFSRALADARDERRAYARLALSMPPHGPMETTFEYSNNGYVVVGAMLEARLGKSWEELIRSMLFQPLGLETAGFGAPGRVGATDQPFGHAKFGPSTALQAYPPGSPVTDNVVALGPAGRVHMNLPDLIAYLTIHRDGTDYLKPDTWRTLHTPTFGGTYAMGWGLRPDGALFHAGSNTLWYAEVLIDSRAAVVAAAVTNDGDMPTVVPMIGKALQEAAAAA